MRCIGRLWMTLGGIERGFVKTVLLSVENGLDGMQDESLQHVAIVLCVQWTPWF